MAYPYLIFCMKLKRSFIRLITHSFSSCKLLIKEAKKVRPFYEKKICNIIPLFCIKDRKVTLWKKTEDRFLKALGVVASGLTVIRLRKSLNLIIPSKKSFRFVDTLKSAKLIVLHENQLCKTSTRHWRTAILMAHQYGATNIEALLKIYRSLCFRTLTFNSNTNRTTPHRVSPRGQESKCCVDVSQRKNRMDKTNLRNNGQNHAKMNSISDL